MAHLLHEKSGSVPGAAEQASAGPIPKQPVYRTMLYFLLHELDCVHRLWGQYIDELIQLKALTTIGPRPLSAGSYYLLSDLLYRSAALTNSAGGIVEAFDTDAYGNTIPFSAGGGTGGAWWSNSDTQAAYSACRYVFTGREYDVETGNYFYRARYYEPPFGRFIGRDPIAYSESANLYSYVGDFSANHADPMGKQRFSGAPIAGPSSATQAATIPNVGLITVYANATVSGQTGSGWIDIQLIGYPNSCHTCNWIQFVKLVSRTFLGIPQNFAKVKNVTGSGYGYVRQGEWNVDQLGANLAFYTSGRVEIDADSFAILDQPDAGFLGQFHLEFYDYLICDRRVVAEIHWEYWSGRPDGDYSNISIKQKSNLPYFAQGDSLPIGAADPNLSNPQTVANPVPRANRG
jgi:RHS repeat-associated protein